MEIATPDFDPQHWINRGIVPMNIGILCQASLPGRADLMFLKKQLCS